LAAIEKAQAINDLRASGRQRALILNFGRRSLQYHRAVHDWQADAATHSNPIM
jgi:hypothetical protein